ncbi:ATP-dependent helicase [Neisseria sp. N95_16]|uniref:ATP-dependent helicase n=1 Tax=Neisseria brasiliensis TaxID=2666100 RepID=A0A7X2GXJ7_9NEIS|nr:MULTISPECIES: DEAD/DEAH box helicase [Neisseria]MRN37826.1 ATP-dependent helicase [Neisseria brasiliensis]PJO09820.1 ATP-dependent helicase [Neisseria sp. N95_16]
MLPPRHAIETFINEKALPASIERARDYRAELVEIDGNRATFQSKGSYKQTYRQMVEFNENKPVKVSCSCPYQNGGICKHTVAALRQLAAMSDNGQPEKKTKPTRSAKPKETLLRYPLLDGGLVDFQSIWSDFNRFTNFSFYTADCRIMDFEPGKWTFEASDWQGTFRSTLTRLSEQEVGLACNCTHKTAKQYCSHMAAMVRLAAENLGAECLLPDYRERFIADVLSDYGMTPQDNYAEFFDFSIDDEGFVIQSKVPDLMPLHFSLVSRTIPSEISAKTALPPKAGLVLALNFDEGVFQEFVLYYANLKKNGEISANLKEISDVNAGSVLFNGMLPDEAKDIWYTLQAMNEQYLEFAEEQNVDALGKTVAAFNRFLQTFPDLPLFAAQGPSYARTGSLNRLSPITVSTEPAGLSYRFKEDGALYRLEGRIILGGKSVHPSLLGKAVNPFFIYRADTLTRYPDAKTAADIMRCVVHPSLAVLKRHAETFRRNIIAPLAKHYPITSRDFVTPPKTKRKQTANTSNGADCSFQKQVYVRDSDGLIRFSPAAQYDETLIELPSHALRLHIQDGKFHRLERDEAQEQAFLRFFEALHPDFAQVSDGLYLLTPEQLTQDFWFIDFADSLKNQGIELLGAKDLKSWHYNLNKPQISIRTESGTDWFDLNIAIRYGEETVNLKDIHKAFVNRQNFVTLSDGTIGMLPESWLEKFAPYFQAGEVKKDSIRLSPYQFGIIDQLYESLDDKPEFLRTLYQRRQRLQNLSAQPDVQLSDGLNATLRPYQQHGLNWLAFLHANGLGGCLADDMGLGKTLQTIAFLHYLKTTHTPDKPSLIVAPTSLTFNWLAEIKKFCPGLRVLDYTGAGRLKDSASFDGCDVVLTTYGTLLQDIELLQGYRFSYLILDESQAIKNPLSQRYKAARLIQADNRLILSGTPIENNTFDLYTQLNFLNPGLLGSQSHFKSRFADAIDKKQDQQAAALLAKMVHPFILRRTKNQVAHELPPKTESVIYCEMGKAQRKAYDRVKEQYRTYLLDKIGSDGINKSQMYILEGLTKLRQICNSPALLADADYGSESVKLDTLVEHIKDKTGQHKILVFSSFVKMLALIEGRLNAENIAYEYLDGQTRNRQQKVDRFQNNADIRVFLISTKAGGTGLNLTEADYVFIVDPWWNPAVENQAIDRCYRIGQTKQVMAYRLICRDTVEEKILALQQKKQGIADSLISVDNEKKSFDLDEVKNLFE